MLKSYDSFTSAYVDLLKTVYTTPEYESFPRNLKIRECLGLGFKITNPMNRLPYVRKRNFSIAYAIAETLWYISGNNSTEWISAYADFWNNISDDGKTANSAYGSRIFKPHHYQRIGVDREWTQWDYVKNELKQDRDSRRAIIHIRMPQDSMLANKDVPCTLTLQYMIRDDKLHQIVSMRSSDLILGIAYDVPAFMFFQEMLAYELDVGLGSYEHISNSMHVYERDFALIEEILADNNDAYQLPVPPIPSLPPIDLLIAHEAGLRVVSDYDNLLHKAQSIQHYPTETYWKDWMYVLTGKRAKKLKLSPVVNYVREHLSFDGYRFFNR